MGNDDTRCTGWPTDRDTVRPIQYCQECMRWQTRGGERTPYMDAPCKPVDGRLVCEYRIAAPISIKAA
jgi:hypothetical protein